MLGDPISRNSTRPQLPLCKRPSSGAPARTGDSAVIEAPAGLARFPEVIVVRRRVAAPAVEATPVASLKTAPTSQAKGKPLMASLSA